jgi:hypothetical protein
VTWLDTLLARGDEAKRADTVPLAPARQSAKPRPRADIKAVSVQTAAPFGDNPGAITVGFYSVHDDVLVMRGRNTDREAPALGGRGGSPRRSVPTDARVLAGEDAGLQSPAQLSKGRHCMSTKKPRAFSRRGQRVENCSVLKLALQLRRFQHWCKFSGVWSRKFCSSKGTARVWLN